MMSRHRPPARATGLGPHRAATGAAPSTAVMRSALARRFECEIELKNEIDPQVIGGAIVYAGDQVIDGSLRGRLQKLSNSLAN